MFAVYDTYNSSLAYDRYDHLKLYATEKAARRRAQSDNNAVYPKMDRYAVVRVNVEPEVVWGKVNFTTV